MKAFVGTLPLLPWWRLQNMTDEEIEKFNRKHLVEIEMNDDSAVEDFEKFLKEFEIKMAGYMEAVEAMKKGTALNAFYYDRGWNAAIEAAAKESESKSHILLPLEARIRKLKK